MPVDNYSFDDDTEKESSGVGAASKFKEFDCPSCSANNPMESPFGDGDEILCHYCGCEFRVIVSDGGRFKLREQ